jgi:DNA-binding GntR family transcriptional regulator
MQAGPDDRAEAARNSDQITVPTVVDALVKQLRRVILSGEIKPGGRLVEERLTERFNVSRPPLREALRILQRDGIVQSLPRRGFIVVPITANDVREIYSLRMALERLAVELGVPVADETLLQPMKKALDQMRDAAVTGEEDEMVAANGAFHAGLIGLARHGRLTRSYDALLMQMTLCMAFNLKLRKQAYNDPAESVQRHASLLDCIIRGDREAVLHELEHHGDRSLLDHLDELVEGDM